jgi:hypothetical protein
LQIIPLENGFFLLTQIHARALVRLQADYVSRALVPVLYRLFQAQDPERQIAYKEFSAVLEHLASLLERGGRQVSKTGGAGSGLWC